MEYQFKLLVFLWTSAFLHDSNALPLNESFEALPNENSNIVSPRTVDMVLNNSGQPPLTLTFTVNKNGSLELGSKDSELLERLGIEVVTEKIRASDEFARITPTNAIMQDEASKESDPEVYKESSAPEVSYSQYIARNYETSTLKTKKIKKVEVDEGSPPHVATFSETTQPNDKLDEISSILRRIKSSRGNDTTLDPKSNNNFEAYIRKLEQLKNYTLNPSFEPEVQTVPVQQPQPAQFRHSNPSTDPNAVPKHTVQVQEHPCVCEKKAIDENTKLKNPSEAKRKSNDASESDDDKDEEEPSILSSDFGEKLKNLFAHNGLIGGLNVAGLGLVGYILHKKLSNVHNELLNQKQNIGNGKRDELEENQGNDSRPRTPPRVDDEDHSDDGGGGWKLDLPSRIKQELSGESKPEHHSGFHLDYQDITHPGSSKPFDKLKDLLSGSSSSYRVLGSSSTQYHHYTNEPSSERKQSNAKSEEEVPLLPK